MLKKSVFWVGILESGCSVMDAVGVVVGVCG